MFSINNIIDLVWMEKFSHKLLKLLESYLALQAKLYKHWGHSLMRGVGRWRWVTLHTLLQRLIPGVSSFYTENNHTMCNFDFNNYFYNLAFQINTNIYLKAEMNDKVCGTFLQLHLSSFSLFFLANRSMQVHISTCRTKRTLTRVSEIGI